MKTVVIGILALALTGCSLVFPKAGPQLAKAVNKYCTTVTFEERRLLREQVNQAIQPNQACVHCEGDPVGRCVTQ